MPTPTHHLAQVNVGRLLAPVESEQIAGFVALLAPLNALADDAPGFVWRLQTEQGDATSIRTDPDPLIIVNMSVWETPEALWAYVYRSPHLEAMRRRREWFERHLQPYQALWWIDAGSIPSVEDALERVRRVREHGPTPDAFTFREQFAPDEGPLRLDGRSPPERVLVRIFTGRYPLLPERSIS